MGKRTLISRPSYTANQEFNKVKVLWSKQDVNDIGAGTAITGKRVIVTNSGGWVTAYDDNNGKKVWATKTGGKIYSTPCISGNNIVVASTDNYLYCMDRRSGNVNWKFASEKPMVASPVIVDGYVFCGSSDGHFRCLELSSGKLKWDFNQVKGFIETRPLFYNGLIYFGSWGNHLYALDQKTGALVWNWYDGATNRMFSPAACVPVAVKNRLFIVAPDNYMTCFDAANGNIIWRKKDSTFKVRESMGLSADSSLVYIKTMAGNVLGINANADTMEVTWKAKHNMHGYDICPSPIVEHDGIVFALSDIGSIYAFKREDGSLLWIHKLSNSLVNPISFLSNHQLIATTMDGNITCLQY
jgi:outer membrane protein assembly factor BamB